MKTFCNGYELALLNRRELLMGAGIGIAAILGKSALAQVSLSPDRRDGRLLVVIFLRGGMDGLNTVIPTGEDAYYRLRPGLGVARKDTLRLNDFFGLSRDLEALYPLYQSGELALIHAVGSQDRTRSHFEAMNAMETGSAKASSGANGGWLSRYLLATAEGKSSSIRAVSFGDTLPESLSGAPSAMAIDSLSDYRLDDPVFEGQLARLYASGDDPYTAAGRGSLEIMRTIGRLDPANYKAERGAVYPDDELATGMKQVAFLAKAHIGLEVAALDFGGWDTHVAQQPILSRNHRRLAESVAAFVKDMGAEMKRTTVVIQTEFGRRAAENSGLGTDHGRASVMFVLGGGVAGGKVHGPWPGLSPAHLEDGLDLPVATDYRTPLSEALAHHRGRPVDVFPDFSGPALGLFTG